MTDDVLAITRVAVDSLDAFLAEMPLPTPVVMAGMNIKE